MPIRTVFSVLMEESYSEKSGDFKFITVRCCRYANCRTPVESSAADAPAPSSCADGGSACAASASAASYMVPDVLSPEEEAKANQEMAKEELNLLAKLIGGGDAAVAKDTFKLSLFDMEPG